MLLFFHTRPGTERLRRGQDAGGAGRLVPGIPLCRTAAGSRAGAVAEHAGALYPPGYASVRGGVRDGRCREGRGAALAGRNGAQEADAQVSYQALRMQNARRAVREARPVRTHRDGERGGGDGEKENRIITIFKIEQLRFKMLIIEFHKKVGSHMGSDLSFEMLSK